MDNVLSREGNGQVTWSLGDRQGSIVDLVNEQGEVVNHFVYDSFGNRTEATSADFRFGYTGRELDAETGLYYYRARYYDAAVGRFISEDPIGFSAGDTNLYRYVFNNATNYTDPSGKIIPFILGAAALGGFLGATYGVAEQLDSGQSINSIDWQDVWEKSTIGAFAGVIGAITFTGGATALGTFVPATTLKFAGLGLGAFTIGTQTGTAINHANEGKFWTAGVDIISAGIGWLGLRSTANKFVSEYGELQQQAENALNGLLSGLSKTQRSKYSVAIAAMDTKTGKVNAAFSKAPPPSIISPSLEKRASQIGGIGSTGVTGQNGNIVGCCAEFHSANQLLIEGSQIHNLKFTAAVRPKKPDIDVPTCPNCLKTFKESFSLSENLIDKVMKSSVKRGK